MQLPSDYLQTIETILPDEKDYFLASLSEDSPVSIRLNPLKSEQNPLQFNPEIIGDCVKWSENGFYLKERPSFTFDPLFHTGYYYVQEASSMFIEYIVNRLTYSPVRCLDLCAAPGGKSIGLRSVLPEGSLLVSNEIVRQRAHILSENLIKFGHPDVFVSNNSPSDFTPISDFFDLILVDAPCSGEGMFRKDNDAISEWSIANVQMCAVRQRKIVSDVWNSLKPGGILIYSTCTYNLQENEENAKWFAEEFGASFLSVAIHDSWKITPSMLSGVTAYRFFPHKTKGEGFFVTVFQKPKDDNAQRNSFKIKKMNLLLEKDISKFENWLLKSEDFNFYQIENRVKAIHKSFAETIEFLCEKLKPVSFGIEIGEQKGKNFIPSHSLAMSTQLNPTAFPRYDLSYEEAIAYLRNESFFIDAPNGYVLLYFKNEPVGFMKNIGNRANNLYPQEWRIRSGYLPEKKTDILM